MRYLAIAALLLGLSACAHDPNRDAWRNVRILQAEPKEAYTVVGESWAYDRNTGYAWARLQKYSYSRGADAVIIRTTNAVPNGQGDTTIHVTGTAIKFNAP